MYAVCHGVLLLEASKASGFSSPAATLLPSRCVDRIDSSSSRKVFARNASEVVDCEHKVRKSDRLKTPEETASKLN